MKMKGNSAISAIDILIMGAVLLVLTALGIEIGDGQYKRAVHEHEMISQVIQTITNQGLNARKEISLGNGWYYLSKEAIISGTSYTVIESGITNVASMTIVPADRLNAGECEGQDYGQIIASASRQLGITNGEFHHLEFRQFH